MNALTIALIFFVCVFGSALLGFYLRKLLPKDHMSEDTLSAIKLSTGMIATLASLVLGLLVSSTHDSFNSMRDDFRQITTKVVLLDRALANYGPQTREARDMLRQGFASSIGVLFSGKDANLSKLDTAQRMARVEQFQSYVRNLTPQNDAQRGLQARAQQLSDDIAEKRWLLVKQADSAISAPFLVILVLWLMIIFAGFGLLTANNQTVFITLLLCALSVSSAIFLILELNNPLDGLLRISSAPILNALAILGAN
jgi:hypothetical protein